MSSDHERIVAILADLLDPEHPLGQCISGECCIGGEAHEQLDRIFRRLRVQGWEQEYTNYLFRE